MIFYSTLPEIGENNFKGNDWKDFYRTSESVIRSCVPESRGKYIGIAVFVYSNHAGDTVTRIS